MGYGRKPALVLSGLDWGYRRCAADGSSVESGPPLVEVAKPQRVRRDWNLGSAL